MRISLLRAFALAITAGGLLAGSVAASADAGSGATTYSIRYLGLSIARAEFTTTMDGRDYTISGKLRSAGLAEVFDSTRGTATVRGTVESDRLQAKSYVISYKSGKKASRTEIDFRGGDVIATRNRPKPKPHGKGWIDLAQGDLQAVLDPVSSLIVPAGTPVCPRTVPIYDGETRADLELTPAGRQPFSTHGFRGEAIACSVRFVPKAGYRKGNDAIAYLKDAKGIEVWYARPAGAKVFAPVYARVPTRIGSVTVWATNFGG